MMLFLFCLFLAFVIWTVHKLSGNYSHFFQYNLVVKSDVPGRAEIAVADKMISLRGRASGFYILQQRYGSKSGTLYISPDSRLFRKVSGETDKYFILSSDVREIIAEGLGDKVLLDFISADTITISLPKK